MRTQVEYSPKEYIHIKGFSADPVGDNKAKIADGILHKYKGRILVLVTDACALHCRFCFRRNQKNAPIKNLPQKLSGVLANDPNIKEVILSGGDPLMLSDNELQNFFDVIPAHINIRIHSRMPIAKPERFTPQLLQMLKILGHRLIFVLHCNHPNELDEKSKRIFNFLSKNKITVLNQSVLLNGVNDNAQTLAELSQKLFSQFVMPYYLHQLDRAQGTAHFEVPLLTATKIFKKLKELLPGYLVPKFVKEVAGKKSKVWL